MYCVFVLSVYGVDLLVGCRLQLVWFVCCCVLWFGCLCFEFALGLGGGLVFICACCLLEIVWFIRFLGVVKFCYFVGFGNDSSRWLV